MPRLGKVSLILWLLTNLTLLSYAGSQFRKKYYGTPPVHYSRRSSLSKSRWKYLFPTAAALGGIYVASRMRPRTHLRSYRDLDGYTVCEGRHMEVDSLSGAVRTYSYFLCPDDPDQPFERYCCQDKLRGLGVCCSYDEKVQYYTYSRWGLLGGAFTVVVILVIAGFLVYCLCFRRCRSARNTPSVPAPDVQHTPGAYPGPPPKPSSIIPAEQPCPYPAGPGNPPFPSPQYAPTSVPALLPQPGSGWGATVGSVPGSGWMDAPPPPYSVVQHPSNQASAPMQ